jgi:hypothetical protein
MRHVEAATSFSMKMPNTELLAALGLVFEGINADFHLHRWVYPLVSHYGMVFLFVTYPRTLVFDIIATMTIKSGYGKECNCIAQAERYSGRQEDHRPHDFGRICMLIPSHSALLF